MKTLSKITIGILACTMLALIFMVSCQKDEPPASEPVSSAEYIIPTDLSQPLEWNQMATVAKKGGNGKGKGNGNGNPNQGGGGDPLPPIPQEDIVPDILSDWNIQWDTTTCGYVKVTFDAQPNFNGYKPWVSPPETCATEQDTIFGEPYSSNFYNATSNVMYFYPGIYCLSANKWKKLTIYAFELDTVNNAWIVHQSLPDSIYTGKIVSFCN